MIPEVDVSYLDGSLSDTHERSIMAIETPNRPYDEIFPVRTLGCGTCITSLAVSPTGWVSFNLIAKYDGVEDGVAAGRILNENDYTHNGDSGRPESAVC